MICVLDVYFCDIKVGVFGRFDDGLLIFVYDGVYFLD